MIHRDDLPDTPDWSLPQREALTSTADQMKPLAEVVLDGRGTN